MARTRAPRRRTPVTMSPGQLGLFGSADPWEPSTGCRCWPPELRGCQHCTTCDTCQDCGRCAGRGCTCECDDG
ncbi:hypothetical protein [Streptomyces antibioticus]|uniref:hypothetical protein n=1 Tax=Streptomyces antibioticus TaxID=1890 RepID=UPI003D762354